MFFLYILLVETSKYKEIYQTIILLRNSIFLLLTKYLDNGQLDKINENLLIFLKRFQNYLMKQY